MAPRNQNPTYVAPPAPAVTASSQEMETRPTFAGQADSIRLALFLVVAVAGGVALFLLAGWPVWACVVTAFGVFIAAYFVDTAFATGYLHKAIEQHTERLRIEAALAQNQTGDAAQQAQIDLLLEAVGDLQDRLDKLERHITIVDRSGSRTVAFTDETDTALRKWLRDTIFGGGATPVGVHARNGQIASAMPFKEGSDGFRRLKAAGLVDRIGQNYHYVGPQNVLEALQKLQKPQG